jgi:hypothetical protein
VEGLRGHLISPWLLAIWATVAAGQMVAPRG